MKITITFNTDNDAFEQNGEAEMEYILSQASELLNSGDVDFHPASLHDSNGNTIGTVDLESDEE